MRERAAHEQLLAQEERMREAQARQRTWQQILKSTLYSDVLVVNILGPELFRMCVRLMSNDAAAIASLDDSAVRLFLAMPCPPRAIFFLRGGGAREGEGESERESEERAVSGQNSVDAWQFSRTRAHTFLVRAHTVWSD